MTPSEYAISVKQAERSLARGDPLLRALIKRHGPCGLAPNWRRSPYEALVRAIVYQQLNGKAAATILGRFLELFPNSKFPTPEQILATSGAAMRAVGLSRQKSSYMLSIAEHAASGIVPVRRAGIARLSDEAIVARLTRVKGVGRWTVEMLLMFTLGRLDVMPVDDFGVRSGYTKAAGRKTMVSARELREIAEAWGPYRSAAAWYLWRAAEG
jgi:DNA-3-methyladenine glycosylase II